MMNDEQQARTLTTPQRIARVSRLVRLHEVAVRQAKYEARQRGSFPPGMARTTACVTDVQVGDEIVVTMDFKASARAKGSRKNAFSIQATLEAEYTITEPLQADADDLVAFGEVNSVLNAWPYWREFVTEATIRMRVLPPLIIPVFRAGSFREFVKPTNTSVTDRVRRQMEVQPQRRNTE